MRLQSTGAVAAAIDRIALAAFSEAPVAIVGDEANETRALARMLHERGPRKDGPFVVMPCASLAGVMIESELRAVASSSGMRDAWFRSADTGTFVFDAINELALAAQAALVGILDEPYVLPRRSPVRGPLGVRVITTSSRPLSEHVARGALLESLVYRLASIVVRLPEVAP